jgi:hypothetical protein
MLARFYQTRTGASSAKPATIPGLVDTSTLVFVSRDACVFFPDGAYIAILASWQNPGLPDFIFHLRHQIRVIR